MQVDVLQDGEKISIQVERVGDQFVVRIGEHHHHVHVVRWKNGRLVLQIDGRSIVAVTVDDGQTRYVAVDGEIYRFPKHEPQGRRSRRTHPTGAGGTLVASMPGQIVAVHVAKGDRVRRGQPLVALEAMKMESSLTAPEDGTVSMVYCEMGQTVERGQVLVTLEREEPGA